MLCLSSFPDAQLRILGCATWRRPGIPTPSRGYGFRARSLRSRPGMTGWDCCCSSIHPRLLRDVLDVVGHGVMVDRAKIDGGLAALIHPRQRVLHPVLVVPGGEIPAGMGSAALGAARPTVPPP